MTDNDANIVKVLRSKCNDLEDKLEEATEAKEAAQSTKEAIEEQVEALRKELQALKENRTPTADVPAGEGVEGGEAAEGKEAPEGKEVGDGAEEQEAEEEAQPSAGKKKNKKNKRKNKKGDAKAAAEDASTAAVAEQPAAGGDAKELETCKAEVIALQASLQEQQSRQAELQRQREELETETSELQGKVEEAEEAEEEAKEELTQVDEQLTAAEAKRDTAVERAEQAQKLLLEERERLRELQEGHVDEGLELTTACEEATEAAEAAEQANASKAADASAREGEMTAREAALASSASEELAGLEAELATVEERGTQLHRETEQLEATRQKFESQIGEVTTLAESLQEKVAAATEELRATKAATGDSTVRFVQAEEELAKLRTSTATTEVTCKKLSAERDTALSRAQQANRLIAELEENLAALTQRLQDQEANMGSEGEARLAKLQASVAEEEGQVAELQEERQQLQALQQELQGQTEEMTASHEEVQLEWTKLDAELSAAAEASLKATNAARQKEAELAEERERAKHLHDVCNQLSAELRHLQGLEGEVEVPPLEEQLSEVQEARTAWTDEFQKLQQQCEEHAEAIKEHRQRAHDAAAELEEERRSRGEELSGFRELQRQHEDLEAERAQLAERAQALTAQLEEEKRLHAEGAAGHEELQAEGSKLEQKCSEAAQKVAQLTEQLAEKRQVCAAGDLKRGELEAQVQEVFAKTKACAESQTQFATLLTTAKAEREAEARRAAEFQVNLDAVKPAQQELENKCVAAMEQLDALRCVNEEIVLEKGRLQAVLAQEQEAAEQARRDHEETKKALESAGPSKLSVGDALISVAFHGVSQPLVMMPWDGDLEAVVSNWLAVAQRSARLQSSLVRYLTHLEETASTFPVRVEASLMDVDEEFAV